MLSSEECSPFLKKETGRLFTVLSYGYRSDGSRCRGRVAHTSHFPKVGGHLTQRRIKEREEEQIHWQRVNINPITIKPRLF